MFKFFARRFFRFAFVAAIFPLLSLCAFSRIAHAQNGKTPVIVIPGLVGSELVNKKTGEVVWFKAQRSKTDDLRLPLSADLAANRDNLVARDILRVVKIGLLPRIESYGSLIKSLEAGGYRESSWENPPADGFRDAVYIFAYDWRRDNVENARLLIEKIENLKRKLRQPDLKFNVVAHSMGGLIARYAAMYADADLPTGSAAIEPTWAGARYFDTIFLLGTPNEGSLLALNSLANNFSLFGLNINLPFVQNLTKFDTFTIPSIYQLLPADGTLRAFDENLKPISVDFYDEKTWEKYGWNPADDKDFALRFGAADRRNARAYFSAALVRARRFHEALDAGANLSDAPIPIFLIGGDCKDTLDAIVIRRDEKANRFTTLFKAESFRRAADGGKTVSAAELKKLMFASGDGIVTKRSLLAGQTETTDGAAARIFFQCEEHNNLVVNRSIQDNLLKLLK